METTQATFDPMIWENPMGEARKDALRLDFDLRLKLEFHCDEPSVEIEQCGEVLQQARHIKSCSRANFQQSGFESESLVILRGIW
jgi:hypothetical protein